jgi:hypothetical protein
MSLRGFPLFGFPNKKLEKAVRMRYKVYCSSMRSYDLVRFTEQDPFKTINFFGRWMNGH